jgi:membrane fusion protein, heavy metal efflux system
MILATSITFSCGKSANDEAPHTHGPDPLAYTLYSDKIELFVEFKSLVVGSQSKFAAHFTVLDENFKSLNDGKVTVSLITGENGIRNTANSASSPGIFRLALKPNVAGKGKLIFDITTPDFTDQIVINDVTIYADEKSALADMKTEADAGEITYLKEQAWKVEFANAPVFRKPFHEVVKTTGQILTAPGEEAVVSSKIAGIVQFSNPKWIEGASVNAGANMFVVSPQGMNDANNLEAQITATQVNLEKAKTEYNRNVELAKDKLITEREVLQAKVNVENAEIALANLNKNYGGGSKSASSPMGGFIKNLLVKQGQFVEAGTPLATITKSRKLVLQAQVSQKDVAKMQQFTTASFSTPENNTINELSKLNGRIISYSKNLTNDSPFALINFEFDNIGNFMAGSMAEIYLKTNQTVSALVIPISSLIEEQGNFFAYVQTGGESFQKRELKLGASDGVSVQVLNGLTEGERVVTKGGYQIKLSSASGALPAHGHEH